jgi:hypothetical protein
MQDFDKPNDDPGNTRGRSMCRGLSTPRGRAVTHACIAWIATPKAKAFHHASPFASRLFDRLGRNDRNVCPPFRFLPLVRAPAAIVAAAATRRGPAPAARPPRPVEGRDRTVWGAGPHGLGSGTARFGERDRTVWGAGPHGLGSGTARFGERDRTVWGADFSLEINSSS